MMELIDRTRFHSLTDTERQMWEGRLRERFDVPLQDTVQFYVDGDDVVGVVRYRRDALGRLIVHNGMTVERYVLGVVPSHCSACGCDKL